MRQPFSLSAATALLLLAGACRDVAPTGVEPPTDPPPQLALTCEASVQQRTLGCGNAPAGGASLDVVGGQGVRVRLTSRDVTYDSARGVFTAWVKVQNLVPGTVLGSHDGITAAGIRVFFHAEPWTTGGSGEVAVRNADGTTTVTGVQQPFFSYARMLPADQESDFQRWEFAVPGTVRSFGFEVYLEAPVFVEGSRPEVAARFAQLSGGGAHSCGLTAGGRAFCWGDGTYGRLGTASNHHFPDPAPVVGDHSFRQVAAGAAHTCALDEAGAAWCWGLNSVGQVGVEPAVDPDVFYQPIPSLHTPTAVTGGVTFTALDAGGNFTCALDPNGRAFCWGDGGSGRLGRSASGDSYLPVAVETDERFTRIFAGGGHACGLTSGSQLWCWGSNARGQLARPCGAPCGTTDSLGWSAAPVRVELPAPIVDFDAGSDHSCAITSSGVALCWGHAHHGVLGRSVSTAGNHVPGPVTTSERFTRVFAGFRESCALRADGAATCWGQVTWDGTFPVPVSIRPQSGRWAQMALYGYAYYVPCGYGGHCGPYYIDGRSALESDGDAFGWGGERHGEVGNGGALTNGSGSPGALAPLHVYDAPPKAGFYVMEGNYRLFIGDPTNAHDSNWSTDDYGIVGTRLEWSFGDGTTATGNYVNHTFAANGTYNVTLTVYDRSGQRGMHTMPVVVNRYTP